jgi:hypothetical protein
LSDKEVAGAAGGLARIPLGEDIDGPFEFRQDQCRDCGDWGEPYRTDGEYRRISQEGARFPVVHAAETGHTRMWVYTISRAAGGVLTVPGRGKAKR